MSPGSRRPPPLAFLAFCFLFSAVLLMVIGARVQHGRLLQWVAAADATFAAVLTLVAIFHWVRRGSGR